MFKNHTNLLTKFNQVGKKLHIMYRIKLSYNFIYHNYVIQHVLFSLCFVIVEPKKGNGRPRDIQKPDVHIWDDIPGKSDYSK